MPDSRNSTALRQLTDLGHEPAPSRWSWATARYEPGGRVRLPAVALAAVGFLGGDCLDVWGVCNRVALVVRPDGPGARWSSTFKGGCRCPRGCGEARTVRCSSAPTR